MKTIEIFETVAGCCGPGQSAPLVSFLERKFRGQALVRAIDVGKAGEHVSLPPALIEAMATVGAACLPAVVVDGVVVSQGKLPNFMEAVNMVTASSSAHPAAGSAEV